MHSYFNPHTQFSNLSYSLYSRRPVGLRGRGAALHPPASDLSHPYLVDDSVHTSDSAGAGDLYACDRPGRIGRECVLPRRAVYRASGLAGVDVFVADHLSG